MKSKTKADLTTDVWKESRHRIPCAECLVVFDMMMEIIARTTVEEDRCVQLRGFGVFFPKTRQCRPGRNIRTGEIVPIPRRRIMRWRPNPELVKAVKSTPAPTDTVPDAEPKPVRYIWNTIQDHRTRGSHP